MKENLITGVCDLDSISDLWRKTIHSRRLYIRTHSVDEVLEKFPGYRLHSLVSFSRRIHFWR